MKESRGEKGQEMVIGARQDGGSAAGCKVVSTLLRREIVVLVVSYSIVIWIHPA